MYGSYRGTGVKEREREGERGNMEDPINIIITCPVLLWFQVNK